MIVILEKCQFNPTKLPDFCCFYQKILSHIYPGKPTLLPNKSGISNIKICIDLIKIKAKSTGKKPGGKYFYNKTKSSFLEFIIQDFLNSLFCSDILNIILYTQISR